MMSINYFCAHKKKQRLSWLACFYCLLFTCKKQPNGWEIEKLLCCCCFFILLVLFGLFCNFLATFRQLLCNFSAANQGIGRMAMIIYRKMACLFLYNFLAKFGPKSIKNSYHNFPVRIQSNKSRTLNPPKGKTHAKICF